jgi:hypothetical protein
MVQMAWAEPPFSRPARGGSVAGRQVWEKSASARTARLAPSKKVFWFWFENQIKEKYIKYIYTPENGHVWGHLWRTFGLTFKGRALPNPATTEDEASIGD